MKRSRRAGNEAEATFLTPSTSMGGGSGEVEPAAEELLTEQQTNRILRDRALALAATPKAAASGDLLDLMIFEVADEIYGIETHSVLEVVVAPEVALLPGARPPLTGLMVWRGEVLPMLDGRSMLHLAATDSVRSTMTLVVGTGRPAFAFGVDDVSGVRRISATSLVTPTDHNHSDRSHIRGVTEDALVVLAAEALIRTHEQEET